MTKNVRFILGALALAALVSAWYLLMLTGDSAAVANREREALALRSLMDDIDGDGLVARDEQYWQTDPKDPDTDGDGFVDGEEIMSGHDPRVPGPKYYLDRRQNLTQQTTDLLIGGILSGDLSPENPDYQETVTEFVQALTDRYGLGAESTLVQLKTSSDSDEAKLAYLKDVLTVYPDMLSGILTDIDSLLESVRSVRIADSTTLTGDAKLYATFQQEALRISDDAGAKATAGLSIKVPPAFRRQHTNFILTLQLLQTDLRLAANMHEDPMLGMVALQRIVRLSVRTFPEVLHDFFIATQKKL
jgi:hypothetical protein